MPQKESTINFIPEPLSWSKLTVSVALEQNKLAVFVAWTGISLYFALAMEKEAVLYCGGCHNSTVGSASDS